eukprot:87047_1
MSFLLMLTTQMSLLMATNLTSFGFWVPGPNVGFGTRDTYTVDTIRATLYWYQEIMQCTLTPYHRDAWYFCDKTSTNFVHCFNENLPSETRMNFEIFGNDALWMHQVYVIDNNIRTDWPYFCSYTQPSHTYSAPSNCDSWPGTKAWHIVCLDGSDISSGTQYRSGQNHNQCSDWSPAIDIELKPGSPDSLLTVASGAGQITCNPTSAPTNTPTATPTNDPTADPTVQPTMNPTVNPTMIPTSDPTTIPTMIPTHNPTADPTNNPTFQPTIYPTFNPTPSPTAVIYSMEMRNGSLCNNLYDNIHIEYEVNLDECIRDCQAMDENCRMVNFFHYFKSVNDSRCYIFDKVCDIIDNDNDNHIIAYKILDGLCIDYPFNWVDNIGD